MEYEIDVRKYTLAVLHRWRWVALCIVIAASTAAGLTYSLPPYYRAQASALIQIRQTGSQVGLNSPVLNLETIDAGARRQALQALATSPAIEARLPEDLLQRIAPPRYKPGQLYSEDHINTELQGDLLIIAARARTAQQAKELADAWTRTFVDYANQLYTDGHSEVKLVGEALLPYQPEPTGLIRNTLLAAFGGALLGMLLALGAEITGVLRADRRRIVQSNQPVTHPSPSR